MYEVYLAHHGILGQKWGVRRYQNPDGSLTAAGKKRYAIDEDGKIRKLTGSERRAIEKSDKQRAAALEKARKARVEKAEYNKQKAEAIKSGDASKIEKYFNDLTPAEMKEATDRINTKQNFQKLLNNEAQLIANGKTKTDSLVDKMGKFTDFADKGIKVYNVIAKINNAFNSDAYMPQIDGTWAGDRKKELAKEAKKEAKEAAEERENAAKRKKEQARQEFLKTASIEDILKHPEKVNLKEYDDVKKRFQVSGELANKLEKNKAKAAEKANKERAEGKIEAEKHKAERIDDINNFWEEYNKHVKGKDFSRMT